MKESPTAASRSIRVPASTLGSIREIVEERCDPATAVLALQAAGYRAGESMYPDFERAMGRDPAAMGRRAFFRSLSDFLTSRGWGSIRLEEPHTGVGLLVSNDWAEASDGGEPQPSCAFSAGLLAGLLTAAAAAPVAVLQVTCRSCGDESCGFAFGSGDTVSRLYGELVEGQAMDSALAAL